MPNKEYDWNRSPDDLDRALDEVLAKYASVEPRAGLQDRILANLRSADVHAPKRARWQWGFAAALALVVLTIALAWRTHTISHPIVANQTPKANDLPANAGSKAAAPEVGTIGLVKGSAVLRRETHRKAPTVVMAPKLDQFPSSQALTEQERMLASYVTQFHDQAVVVALRADQEIQKDRREVSEKTDLLDFEEDTDQTKSR